VALPADDGYYLRGPSAAEHTTNRSGGGATAIEFATSLSLVQGYSR
jgi:hypothetical protein